MIESNDPCTPAAIWSEYPHGLSAATGCNYAAPWDCEQSFDVGVWVAAGRGGNYVIGHSGLNMVLVVKYMGDGNQHAVWNAIRPALIALDPTLTGDEEAFCAAYEAGEYAPSLR